jgi:hypothetical protein
MGGSSTVSVLAHPVQDAIPHELLAVDRSIPPDISAARAKGGKAHPDKVLRTTALTLYQQLHLFCFLTYLFLLRAIVCLSCIKVWKLKLLSTRLSV